ncbi:MAG: DNA-binding transcriptional LysR family regulator [Glaciecola sp.]|jgi:DNA-binding transcriptional LysR family regulator|uniref:LysR substrate-binding domain-containing protein n=1 Tax=Congregibacter sp. TaxID=2744308 RepID=UPI0039E44E63
MAESLRQLRHVLALCEHRNYRRAAESLGLTQSALSVSIRRLEDDYGVALFERGQSGVHATEFGEIIARTARTTLGNIDQARREVDLLSNLNSGRVVIGSDPWMADRIVAPALARLLRKYPKLRFRLRTHGWDELQEDLLARNVDVYVGSRLENVHSGIHTQSFALSSPVIICRREHPLTRLPALHIADVLPYPLVVPKLPGWYLDWLGEQYSTTHSSEELHDLFLRADDLTVIRQIVRETDAVTASLFNTFPPDLSSADFSMLHIADLSHIASPGVIATLSDRPVPVALQGFIDEVLLQIESLGAMT